MAVQPGRKPQRNNTPKPRKQPAQKQRKTLLDQLNFANLDTNSLQKRLPALILIDASGSMIPYEKHVKDCVQMIYNGILTDPPASRAVELGIVAFNDTAPILQPISEIYRQLDKDINISRYKCKEYSPTLMGAAVEVALAQLRERVALYKASKSGIRCYPPILFIISDGKPFCADKDERLKDQQKLEDACEEIQLMTGRNELVVLCFEMGDNCNHELMQRLTGTDNPNRVYRLNEDDTDPSAQIEAFFRITTSIMISQSSGMDLDASIANSRKKR